MGVWGGPEHFWSISETAERSRTDELVSEIADALAAAGEYRGRVDMLPTQKVVDFTWAAHQAGRRLGIRIAIDLQIARVDADGHAPVVVTPQRAPD